MAMEITLTHGQETITVDELQQAVLVATGCIVAAAKKVKIGSPRFKQYAKTMKDLRTAAAALSPREPDKVLSGELAYDLDFSTISEMYEWFATLEADSVV